MGLRRRQVFRLAKAYAEQGPEALVSRSGRSSNRAYPADLRDVAIGIIRERYSDFGPTLVPQKRGFSSQLTTLLLFGVFQEISLKCF